MRRVFEVVASHVHIIASDIKRHILLRSFCDFSYSFGHDFMRVTICVLACVDVICI